MTTQKTKPVHTIKLGRVRAAIWANPTRNGDLHTVTVSRIFKRDDGWGQTASFRRDELPLVAKIMDQAHTWIFAQRA